jgi:exodeoxyribonuclease VII large subunit
VAIKYQLKTTNLQYQPVEGDSLASELSKPKALSVTELTRGIKSVLEGRFTGLWIEGELSNFKHHSSGHMYFCLKDEGSTVNAVMFRRENVAIGFEPVDGMCVLVFARVSVYEPRGQYQLMVERMEPKGVGALQLKFEAMKEKLRKEGLFEESRKRPIPFMPKRVAVVTSIDGAALRDILHVLERRFSSAHILIYPTPVQGIAAAPAVAEAIEALSREHAAEVVIVARGGGSLEDLWAFNEESVARAIASSEIPVISAVGHETDFTIADFVSDLRAPTPSAAAEIVMPVYDEVLARVEELKARSTQAVSGLLVEYRERLEDLRARRSLKDPLAVFEALFQRLDELKKGLGGCFKHFLVCQREKAGNLVHKLDALGPLATLKRGFSVTTTPEGKVLASVKDAKQGQSVRTVLKDGSFTSKITEVKHGG